MTVMYHHDENTAHSSSENQIIVKFSQPKQSRGKKQKEFCLFTLWLFVRELKR